MVAPNALEEDPYQRLARLAREQHRAQSAASNTGPGSPGEAAALNVIRGMSYNAAMHKGYPNSIQPGDSAVTAPPTDPRIVAAQAPLPPTATDPQRATASVNAVSTGGVTDLSPANAAGLANRDASGAPAPSGAGLEGRNGFDMYSADSGGMFTGYKSFPIALPKVATDPNYDANKLQAQAGALGAALRPIDAHMNAASSTAANMGPGATIATGPQDQFRTQQMGLGNLLAAGAAGNGPSAAQAQLKLATDRNMGQALSLALGSRGNQAAALKQAGMQRAAISQEAGGQSAALAAQEQQAAQQALGGVLSSGRGADIGLATEQAGLQQGAAQTTAGLQQQTNLANAGFQQDAAKTTGEWQAQQQAQKDALVQSYLAMGMSLDAANLQATIQQRQFGAGLFNQGVAAANNVAIQNSAQGMQLVGAGLSAGGGLLGAALSAGAGKK